MCSDEEMPDVHGALSADRVDDVVEGEEQAIEVEDALVDLDVVAMV